MKLFIYIKFIIAACLPFILLNNCADVLDKQPLDEVSEAIFWQTASDAELALNGVYNRDGNWRSANHIVQTFPIISDNAVPWIPSQIPIVAGALNPSTFVGGYWNGSYQQIAKCNNFLRRIAEIDMGTSLKNQYIAEVRFFRAWEYYNLIQWFGSVPLVRNVLTMDEANSLSITPKEEIVEFILDELDDITPDLPLTRPSAEHGRIIRGAAYAVKGRLLMAEERWSEAAMAFEELIDLGVHFIDPDYRGLFDGSNEQSSEIIFTSKYLADIVPHSIQLYVRPHMDGGWAHVLPTKDLVDSYLCNNGQTIDECQMYQNADNFHEEFVNQDGERYRDPRLYMSIYIDGIHELNGETFYGHPERAASGDAIGHNVGNTGYVTRKWIDEEFTGNIFEGGNDIVLIRYAEVLLNYLESKIKAGEVITQDLLDSTINQLRLRESVTMPPINRADYGSAMDLWNNSVKRERRIELAFEGIRFWDLIRWDEAAETLVDRTFYGMKLTENPEGYTAFDIDEEGYFRVHTNFYREHYHPWPIPQTEIDINSNLTQKVNWQ